MTDRHQMRDLIVRGQHAFQRLWKWIVTVCGGILAIAGVAALVTGPCRKPTFDPLEKLRAGQDIEYFNSKLGTPERKDVVGRYLRWQWRSQRYLLTALTIRDGVDSGGTEVSTTEVAAMGYTTFVRDGPEIPLVTFGENDERVPFEAHVGRQRFADLPDAPTAIAGTTGMASSEFTYGERHYYWSDEERAFVQVIFAVQQDGYLQGIHGEKVTAALSLLAFRQIPIADGWGNADPAGPTLLRSMLSSPATRKLRQTAVFNTVWVLNRYFPVEDAVDALGLTW